MTKQSHTFQVTHPELGTVTVPAADRYAAIVAAAKEWDARWTQIAKDCTVTDLGTAKLHLCRMCGKPLDTPGYCSRCQTDRREIERRLNAQRQRQRRG